MKKIIFWGATGQAKVLKECLKYSELQLIAVFDNNSMVAPPFPEIPLLIGKIEFEQWLLAERKGNNDPIYFAVAIGGDRGKVRLEIQNYLTTQGLEPVVIKHPTAFVAEDVVIGAASQILAQSAVCTGTIIGENCIINTGASVDHECVLGNGVHICPGAHLAGCIQIGDCSMIGTGATILPRLKIGKNVIVGAGSVVLKNVPDHVVVIGNPAKFLRKINE